MKIRIRPYLILLFLSVFLNNAIATNFDDECAQSGVVLCNGFDEAADISGKVAAAWDTTTYPEIDTDIPNDGSGYLKITFVSDCQQNCGGFYRDSFTGFTQNETWRVRYDLYVSSGALDNLDPDAIWGSPLNITGSITSGTNVLTVSDASALVVGRSINIQGSTGSGLDKTMRIDSIDGNEVTLAKADSTPLNAHATITNEPIIWSVWDDVQGTQWKQSIFFQNVNYGNSELTTRDGRKSGYSFPIMYTQTGSTGMNTGDDLYTWSGYWMEQSGTLSDGFNVKYNYYSCGSGNGTGAFCYPAGEWITFYWKFTIGAWGEYTSNVEAWVKTDTLGSYKKWLNVHGMRMLYDTAPSDTWHQVDLLNFMSGVDHLVTPPAFLGYDRLIISADPIGYDNPEDKGSISGSVISGGCLGNCQ